MSGVKKAIKKVFKVVTSPITSLLGDNDGGRAAEAPAPAVDVDSPTDTKEAGMETTTDTSLTKKKAGKRGLKINRVGSVGTGVNV